MIEHLYRRGHEVKDDLEPPVGFILDLDWHRAKTSLGPQENLESRFTATFVVGNHESRLPKIVRGVIRVRPASRSVADRPLGHRVCTEQGSGVETRVVQVT